MTRHSAIFFLAGVLQLPKLKDWEFRPYGLRIPAPHLPVPVHPPAGFYRAAPVVAMQRLLQRQHAFMKRSFGSDAVTLISNRMSLLILPPGLLQRAVVHASVVLESHSTIHSIRIKNSPQLAQHGRVAGIVGLRRVRRGQ